MEESEIRAVCQTTSTKGWKFIETHILERLESLQKDLIKENDENKRGSIQELSKFISWIKENQEDYKTIKEKK